ncbi:cysteine--tRNA ligase [Collimonas arenae]|uniref:Cysteine--tRNA ligase n=1 Tax=Collimonas arenae TaxID=279058 RepID=A0A127PJK1_9BURK|nr:cysteine--tRNA ligase [Collimonas arenae]AMO98002.1 cysteine--tRNA ligase [Collimonas arenae]AMP07865.1 cysteine--tRNA ligase [Collimonas arenae]
MELHLYDSWERRVRPFESIVPGRVGLYCCGPTVYDYAHIGNLRTYIFEDLLRRTLQFNGYQVQHVINITDVGHLVSDADDGEDKMEKGSRRTGKSAWDIAAFYSAAFMADFHALNLLEPETWCRATEYLPQQIAFIATLEQKGYTYRTADGIYFDTAKQSDYGYMARLDRHALQAGVRVALGDKRSATDFALWKFSPPDVQRQMEWDSPWGRGFPGWHIECSAMSAAHLGSWFDIHCGGEDHIAVHHSNEIAQTQACHGTRLANFWMHGYFLQTGSEKMSKSSGEFLRLQTLLDRGIDPLAYRYLCLSAHYRSQLEFSWDGLQAAAIGLQRLRDAYHRWPQGGHVDDAWLLRFRSEVNNDLNFPRALALMWELVRSDSDAATCRATLRAMDDVLGLDLDNWRPAIVEVPEAVTQLAAQRQAARSARQWQEADRLRELIRASGFLVEDTAAGPALKPVLQGVAHDS